MAKNIDWLPKRMPDQLTVFENVKSKIDAYQAVLPITVPQKEKILLICDTFIGTFNFAAQAKAVMTSVTPIGATTSFTARPRAHLLRPLRS